MAQSPPPPPQSLPGLDPWVFSQGWGWAQHSDSTSPASSSDSSGSCPCYITRCPSQSEGLALSWGSPPVCPGPRVSPENLGNRIANVDPWVTPPYCPQIQSPLNQCLGRAPGTSHWTPPQAYSGMQTSPEPRNKTGLWSPSTAPAELTEVYQSLSVSPEPCLSLESPPFLHRPSCQRLQPQPQWGCWSHNAEVLSSSKDQGSSPASQLPVASPIPTSGLQLSGYPELWQEDLEGPPLNIFY
ncbi:mesoderm posterior protein 2 isoform X1 [Cricetulus griseus]|uniref:mesoderm posterior protein 2 isoform X1 n=1 Tax=Cricetulus griseus TaxID=10029 RepID=UPI00045476F0|nr:mesoderm posterior protein 2 isoform X1 [Cricetulus griseus]